MLVCVAVESEGNRSDELCLFLPYLVFEYFEQFPTPGWCMFTMAYLSDALYSLLAAQSNATATRAQSYQLTVMRMCNNRKHVIPCGITEIEILRLVIVTLEERPPGHQHADAIQESKEHHARKELEAIFLVLDCIIDLGLSGRGLSQLK